MVYRLDFPTDKGRITLNRARAPYRITGPTWIDMDGFHIWLFAEGTERAQPLWGLIRFKVIPLDSRTEIIAECNETVLMAYFEGMLAEIGECWPETKEWLEGEIGGMAEEPIEQRQPINKQKRPYVKERQRKVLELSKSGWLVETIAKHIGCSESTVKRDRKDLREEGLL